MNRLVLIGNGFDLAHGLKTSYADFINWYWEQWGKRLMVEKKYKEEDDFCSFELSNKYGIGNWYLVKGLYFQDINMNAREFIQKVKIDSNLCSFKYKSPFFEQINKQIGSKGWVDIENEYYTMLVNEKGFGDRYHHLNLQLEFLRNKLIEYLKQENNKELVAIEEIKDKLYCPIKTEEIAVADKNNVLEIAEIATEILLDKKEWTPSRIMLLNFNYTDTLQHYSGTHSNVTINHIHGHIGTPDSVIFGYGDELDREFPRLKELNDNECLRHVKSIRYLESDRYRKMLEFLESEPFQVCIIGHSCGNSDRTLLNTIFEHPNCISIKPYYYIKENGEDNYLELVQNISRNFTDMKLFRDRVVNKEYCEPLVTDEKKSSSR